MVLFAQRTLQLRTPEVFDDVLPVWRVVVPAQIWLELPAEYLEGSALADTVRPHEPKYVAWSGHREFMELEAVGRVPMADLSLEVRGQVDDSNGPKWALLGTDAASNTETLGNESDSRLCRHLNAELAASHNGAGLLAFLATFLRFAFVAVDDRNTAI